MIKTNEISGINDEDGIWTKDPEMINQTFINYFNNLFKTSNPEDSNVEEALRGIQPRVTQSMNNKLLAHFSKAEIKLAINQMFPT